MSRFFAVARALAHATALAGSIVAVSGALTADAATKPIVLASLNQGFTESTPPIALLDRVVPAPSKPVETKFTGAASFYEENGETSSGEKYDGNAFTAAAQIMLRDQFGGLKFGKNYQPVYGIAEYNGKKAILRFNDVGPLAPGRKFDFTRAVMEYFDGIELGVLQGVTVTLLPFGQSYAQGPVTDGDLAAIALAASGVKYEQAAIEFPTTGVEQNQCEMASLPAQSIKLDSIMDAAVERNATQDIVGAIGQRGEIRDAVGVDTIEQAPAPAYELWILGLTSI
ncbi:MAG: RlpA-like double-psi beta-barrel domain-containing protein [Pseudolabrys sp.]